MAVVTHERLELMSGSSEPFVSKMLVLPLCIEGEISSHCADFYERRHGLGARLAQGK